jgi:hypothetical protein
MPPIVAYQHHCRLQVRIGRKVSEKLQELAEDMIDLGRAYFK